jgi:hypothetical protein
MTSYSIRDLKNQIIETKKEYEHDNTYHHFLIFASFRERIDRRNIVICNRNNRQPTKKKKTKTKKNKTCFREKRLFQRFSR